MSKVPRIVSLLAVASLAFVACGGDDDDPGADAAAGDDGGASAELCAGVDTAELEDIWGDVEANEIGGMCSIVVADGVALRLTRAEASGSAGLDELVDGLIGGETAEMDIGDEAVAFTGSSSGDGYIVRVGDVVFKLAAVDVPEGQLQATAESIAANL